MRNSLLGPVCATLTALSLLIASGCGRAPASARAPDGMGGAPNPATMPDDPSGPPSAQPTAPVVKASYAGAYTLETPLDFTQNGVLPGLLGPALASLSEVHDQPGTALLSLVEAANVPYLSDILQKVPSFLKGVIAGVLNTVITDAVYQGNPVLDQVASLVQGISGLANHLNVHTTLTLAAPAADGSATAELAATAVEFEAFGQKQLAPLPMASLAAARLTSTAQIAPHANAPVADADLDLGGGTLELPIGNLILDAAGDLIFSPFGGATDLKGVLAELVPCDDVAAQLAAQLDGYLTVDDAKNLCSGALSVLADQVTAELTQVTLDIAVEPAHAELLDASPDHPARDHQADQIVDGAWKWKFTVGGGQVEVPATFRGPRSP